MNNSRLESIQWLRGLAALAVVGIHISDMLGVLVSSPLDILDRYGNAGVDIFFVISGFIMVITTAKQPFSGWDFIIKRSIRVAPSYWVYTTAFTILALMAPSLFSRFQPHLSDYIGSIFFIPHQDPDGLILPILVVGWTLNFEMFFYLCFAVLRARSEKAPVIILFFFATLIIVGLFTHSENSAILTYTSPLIIEFAAGCFIGYIYNVKPISKMASWILGIVGIIAIAVLPWHFNGENQRVISYGLGAFLIVFSAAFGFKDQAFLENRLMLLLGNMSYSIYLTHTLVFRAVATLVKKGLIPPMPLLISIISLCFALIGGWIGYRWIERPLNKSLTAIYKRVCTPRVLN